jgi:hypothetical protein
MSWSPPYPSVIVEVTPDEFEMIQRKELPLPEGWMVGKFLPKLEPQDRVAG